MAPVNFEDIDQMVQDFEQRRNNILANKKSRGYRVQRDSFNSDIVDKRIGYGFGVFILSVLMFLILIILGNIIIKKHTDNNIYPFTLISSLILWGWIMCIETVHKLKDIEEIKY